MNDLLVLETHGWQALATSAEAGRKFYATVLQEDAVMVFPGGLLLRGKEEILKSFAAQPWESFDIQEPAVTSVTGQVKILFYRVKAQRKDSPPYQAWISSTYVHGPGGWRLFFHQHTPLA